MSALLRKTVIGLLVLLLSCPGWAQPQRVVEALVAQSGMDDLLAQYPVLIRQTLRRNLASQHLPPGLAKVFDRVVEGNFAAAALVADFSRELDDRLDEQVAAKVLDWYRSPLGRKIVRAEMGAVAGQDMDIGLDALRERYRGSERERLFGAFDRATASTETMLDNAQILQMAMAAAVTSVVRGPDLPTYQELKALIAERRARLRGRVGEQAYLNYLYTYRHLNLDELKAYIRFARTPAGQAFVHAVNQALKRTLEKRSDALSRDLARRSHPMRTS